jgi:hypothetical protein
MKLSKLSLKEVEKAVAQFDVNEQRQLLIKLPHLLKISPDDLSLLKLSEPSFRFWDNPEDAIYDSL